LRERAGGWRYLRIHQEQLVPQSVAVSECLHFKELLVRPTDELDSLLEIEVELVGCHVPRVQEGRAVEEGVVHLNRPLAIAMLAGPEIGHGRLLNFLRLHSIDGQQLMLAPHLTDVTVLRDALREALRQLDARDPGTPWAELAAPLGRLGFEP